MRVLAVKLLQAGLAWWRKAMHRVLHRQLPGEAIETLGRYQIGRPLGHGAMGTVYLGHDPQLGHAVAIKTMALSREFDASDLAEARVRFFREAEAAARLRHPDIVAVYEAGEARGLVFIAMEYVAGHDLSRHTRAGSLLPVPPVSTHPSSEFHSFVMYTPYTSTD